MTGFTIGLIAAAIWILVAVGLWYLHRHTPRHPFRSIGDFRRARRKLAEPIAEPDPTIRLVPPSEYEGQSVTQVLQGPGVIPSDDAVDEGQPRDYPVPEEQLALFRPNPRREPPTQERPKDEPELDEINEVIESVTSEERPRPKSSRGGRKTDASRKRTAAVDRPIRKIGRFTYVVVDDEGKPQADPR